MEHHRAKMILEAALLSASEPLRIRDILQMFDGTVDEPFVLSCLEALRSDWSNRGLELVELGLGWRFQTRSQVRHYIESIHPEKPPKYSRAVLETLAIIAYKQPVTRGDIESIRGVTVSSQVVKSLEDRGWIEVIGHREVLGRPALWATTPQFLADLGLKDLSSLPSLEEDNTTDAFQNVIPLNVDQITRNNENTTT